MSDRRKKRKMTCEQCGNPFHSSRIDATYCSNTCRTHARRASQAKDKAIARAKAAIDDLMKYCVSPSAADCMHEIIGWLTNPADRRELQYQIREVISEGE